MKFGIENLLTVDNVTFTSDVAPIRGGEEECMLDNDTQELTQYDEGDVTIRLEFAATEIDLIALFNVDFGTALTINTYPVYPGPASNTKTYTLDELTGLFYKNAFLELTDTTAITAIELVITGYDYESAIDTYIGYLWAGKVVDLGCVENIQPADISTDTVTMSRVNHPDINDYFEYQTFDVTLKKDNEFETLRDNMRQILNTGYGTPRPWLFNEPFFPADEIVLAILDSGKISYDIIPVNAGDFIAQTTIGIEEVF